MKPVDPRLFRYARSSVSHLAITVLLGSATAVLVVAQAGLLATGVARIIQRRGTDGLGALLVALLNNQPMSFWPPAVLVRDARRHGVRVSVLCPGAIRTPILTGGKFGRLKMPGVSDDKVLALWERMRPMAPRELARKTLAAMDRDEAIIVFPRWWKALWYLDRVSPRASEALWIRLFARMRQELGAP